VNDDRALPYTGKRVDKPWGYELIWAATDRYVGKILHIEAGEALSLQYHQVKEETLQVLSGRARFEVGDHESALTAYELGPGESIHMPPQRRHRLTALTTCDVLEVSTPELDDVVRLADRYGREGTKIP
jgi:mannose-6-phosphate isomerase-like protein (cupin superfamily)